MWRRVKKVLQLLQFKYAGKDITWTDGLFKALNFGTNNF